MNGVSKQTYDELRQLRIVTAEAVANERRMRNDYSELRHHCNDMSRWFRWAYSTTSFVMLQIGLACGYALGRLL